MNTLPLSKINMKGKFTQSDALIWLSNCLPNVPTVLGDNEESTLKFFFKSSFSGTVLIIEIDDGLI